MERDKVTLIFGGSGFIGSNISKALTSNSIKHLSIGKKECDLTKQEEVLEFLGPFKNYQLDIIFTSSVVRKKDDSIKSQISNVLMVRNLVELIKDKEINTFIFFSSVDVYDQDIVEYSETSQTRNISPYAISKIESENILHDALGDKLTILRMPGVYGPNDNFNSVIGHFILTMINFKTLQITNKGMQTRDYLFVDDISRAVLSLLKDPCDGIFNLSSGNSVKLIEIIDIIASKLKVIPKLEEVNSNSTKKFINISNKKFLNNFSTHNFTPIEKGIQKYIDTLI
jgi:nucleoside-diphosphate-sugar epimerase